MNAAVNSQSKICIVMLNISDRFSAGKFEIPKFNLIGNILIIIKAMIKNNCIIIFRIDVDFEFIVLHCFIFLGLISIVAILFATKTKIKHESKK